MPLQSWSSLLAEAGDSAQDFTVLPASDYDVKIIKAEAKLASTGKIMFAITCEVTSGPYAKRRLWSNLVVSPANPTALGIFFRQMNAIGIDPKFFTSNPSDDQVAAALLNKEFRAQVAVKPYQGSDKNEIKGYFPKTSASNEAAIPPPPIIVPAATAPAPAPAAPVVAPTPSPAPAAAAAAPPVPTPVHEAAAPAPVQPPLPPVPDAPFTAPMPVSASSVVAPPEAPF